MKNIYILFLLIVTTQFIYSQSIVNTPHNLSVNGPGEIKANSESEICLFCHTSHSARTVAPLWNRNDPGTVYTVYTSSTIKSQIDQPNGSSLLCLSCHDGTVALGNVISRPNIIDFTPYVTMPKNKSNLGTDLSDDHPISFLYNTNLSGENGQLKDPTAITPPVSLEFGYMQCTSCHDPHKNTYTDFLKVSTKNSALCNSCHTQSYWTSSSHNTSTKTWNGIAPNPWFNSKWNTVSENACENCHTSHSAGGAPRLLKYQVEENNCLDCHNGNVASQNIQKDFTKTYKHNVFAYTGIHDENEPNLVDKKHVECVDCHSPHASNSAKATAPNVKGSNFGVKGIDQNGIPVKSVSYEYEICYRCHSDNAVTPSSTTRMLPQNNVRMEFDPSNPSFHPVASSGKNLNVPSLISPLSTSSKIYCTDCHSSNDDGSSSGPHGSIYPQILKYQYIKKDNSFESPASYALCYSCHSRTSILSNESFKEHSKHIVDEKTPCNVCHDPHGISNLQGNSMNNTNLINFNTSVVTPSGNGQLKFEDMGLFKGRCYLTCHGKDHDSSSY